MRVRLLFTLIAASFLSVACSGDARPGLQPTSFPAGLAAASALPATSPANASSPSDVSGAWTWSSTAHLTAPPFVAEFIFGIPPEGPITQLRCDSSGTMTLAQTGTAFSGSATQAAICETGEGHVFVPPPAAVPPSMAVADGRLTGHALQFRFVAGDLPCPSEGVITEFDQGMATAFRATGRCIIPGHPQSPVPLDPPPAGTSKTTVWTATRP
jgi:hypothetical protein